MSIPLAIVLLLVGTTHAMNSTCCAPNMSALGYNALTTEFFDYYYEGVTGNNLAEVRGEDRTLYFEAATGTHYTRTPQGCVYVVDPSSIYLRYCIQPGSQYLGPVTMDGIVYHDWEVISGDGAMHGKLVVDDMCLKKITYSSFNGTVAYSFVLFNIVPNPDISRISQFNKTGCVPMTNPLEM